MSLLLSCHCPQVSNNKYSDSKLVQFMQNTSERLNDRLNNWVSEQMSLSECVGTYVNEHVSEGVRKFRIK